MGLLAWPQIGQHEVGNRKKTGFAMGLVQVPFCGRPVKTIKSIIWKESCKGATLLVQLQGVCMGRLSNFIQWKGVGEILPSGKTEYKILNCGLSPTLKLRNILYIKNCILTPAQWHRSHHSLPLNKSGLSKFMKMLTHKGQMPLWHAWCPRSQPFKLTFLYIHSLYYGRKAHYTALPPT